MGKNLGKVGAQKGGFENALFTLKIARKPPWKLPWFLSQGAFRLFMHSSRHNFHEKYLKIAWTTPEGPLTFRFFFFKSPFCAPTFCHPLSKANLVQFAVQNLSSLWEASITKLAKLASNITRWALVSSACLCTLIHWSTQAKETLRASKRLCAGIITCRGREKWACHDFGALWDHAIDVWDAKQSALLKLSRCLNKDRWFWRIHGGIEKRWCDVWHRNFPRMNLTHEQNELENRGLRVRSILVIPWNDLLELFCTKSTFELAPWARTYDPPWLNDWVPFFFTELTKRNRIIGIMTMRTDLLELFCDSFLDLICWITLKIPLLPFLNETLK